jgi:hypothetical protein
MNIPRSLDDDSKPPGDYSRDDEKHIQDTQREGDLNRGAVHSLGTSEARKKSPVKRQGFKKMPVTSRNDTPVAEQKKRASWKKPEVGLHYVDVVGCKRMNCVTVEFDQYVPTFQLVFPRNPHTCLLITFFS